jgi:hypothetical protein
MNIITVPQDVIDKVAADGVKNKIIQISRDSRVLETYFVDDEGVVSGVASNRDANNYTLAENDMKTITDCISGDKCNNINNGYDYVFIKTGELPPKKVLDIFNIEGIGGTWCNTSVDPVVGVTGTIKARYLRIGSNGHTSAAGNYTNSIHLIGLAVSSNNEVLYNSSMLMNVAHDTADDKD